MPAKRSIDRKRTKTASLFRNGQNQAVRIPRDFELPGKEVRITKESDRLILEAVPEKLGLSELLRSLGPLEGEFPDVDEALPPVEDTQM